MPTVVSSIRLFFQEGSSDKVYHATIIETEPGKHTVEVEWGRRGGGLNKGKKAIGVSLEAARKAYDRLVREKTGKGYQEMTEAVRPAAVAPPEGEGSGSKVQGRRARTGQAAQLLNAIDEDALARHLEDDAMLAQQKLDGNRILVHVRDTIIATNRAGELTTLHDAIASGLGELPEGTVLDGEVLADPKGPIYWLFDVLQVGAEDVRGLGYADRWTRLYEELEPGLSGPVRVLPVARGARQKKDLFDRVVAARAEGVVFKQGRAPYKPGRPASGGTQLKYKLTKSADVVLLSNAGNAYQMAVYDGRTLRDVGKVFAGTTNESRATIDELLARGERPIAEVRYLYATDDENLFQPVFVGLRDDKTAKECTRAQLVRTHRGVIELP